MAAYAVLVSTMNTMDQIMNHPHLSASFDNKQIQSLREILDFLLDFIEIYTSHGSSRESRDLESQIASVVQAAENVIESHVVAEIQNGSTSPLNLQTVIEELDPVKEKVMMVKEERRLNNMQLGPSISASSKSKLLTTAKTTAMVGFDDELIQLMDFLTGQGSSRMAISIVGMGGIGKTTLTKNAYENPLIVYRFDIRGWVTISQNFNVRQVILEFISCPEICKALEGSDRDVYNKTEDELGVKLYQILCGRRYLIVLDDIWSVECWEKMSVFFPNNDNGSRVVVTTRLSHVATQFCSSSMKINFLDEDQSWELFCRTTFLEHDCPPELEEIVKVIVKKCKGLPLLIVVIGAFLGKSSRRIEYWEAVLRDINSILKLDEDEHCLNLLSLSYSHLPPHLKPCFLYMGILREDEEIKVSRLIKLFVAEGFLKQNKTQTLEETARDYLKDLLDRNLILVSKWRWDGTAKSYKIHDLIRELCLREAEKEKFLHVMRSILDIIGSDDCKDNHRIVLHADTIDHPQVFDALPSVELVRSLILKGGPLPFKFPLLKVLTMVDTDPLETVFQQVNLRYLLYIHSWNLRTVGLPSSASLPSSVTLLWNLQTLIITGLKRITTPSEIWYMGQLRHLECNEVCIPDPPREECVLQNLQTLGNVVNFNFSRDVCRRIPNIVKLHISYEGRSSNGLNMDLDSLHKLQSLKCCLYAVEARGDFVMDHIFPRSTKKLSLFGWCLPWESVTRIGKMLPRLEVLKLRRVVGPEWEVEEGAFPRLKSLRIRDSDLMCWNSDASHFPVLERLDLRYLRQLDEIPLDFGDIPTLGYLILFACSESAAISSTKILKEQLGLGNEDIKVQVDVPGMLEKMRLKGIAELENFPKKNFHCTCERLSLLQKIRSQAQLICASFKGDHVVCVREEKRRKKKVKMQCLTSLGVKVEDKFNTYV